MKFHAHKREYIVVTSRNTGHADDDKDTVCCKEYK